MLLLPVVNLCGLKPAATTLLIRTVLTVSDICATLGIFAGSKAVIETGSNMFVSVVTSGVPGSLADFNLGLVSVIPDIRVMLSIFFVFPHRLTGLTGSRSDRTWQICFAFVELLYCTS